MRLTLIVYALLLAFTSKAQKGIHFEHDLSWSEIRAKAQIEKKYIFLDCYATWCGPCKLMDREVYPKEIVGAFMNDKFISVRVQFDSSKTDSEQTTSWYRDAKLLQREYGVSSFPTFLYFAPNGKIVHRFSGAVRDTDFVNMASIALDTATQYYTLLYKYRTGEKDYSKMRYLARLTQEMNDTLMSHAIARDYITNFVAKKPSLILSSKKDLDFVSSWSFLLTSKGKMFDYFINNEDTINVTAGNGSFAQKIVASMIAREEIKRSQELNELYETVHSKYGSYYARAVVADEKLKRANAGKDTLKMISAYLQRLDIYGPDTAGVNKYFTNNTMYDLVFKYCMNKKELLKASYWMKKIVDAAPGDAGIMDTYANLLYKAGKKAEAIAAQEQALHYDNLIATANNQQPDRQIILTLEKMKNNEPTW